MMKNNTLTTAYLKELETEYTSTKKCIERIPEKLYSFQPHPTSMKMEYLTLLVAEIPLWITLTINEGVVDFATYVHKEPKTTQDMLKHFEENYAGAHKALQQTNDEDMQEPFELRNKGKVLYSISRLENIASSLNHWVHHRGQLTVYMRMNEIEVPSIYGPSADDKSYGSLGG